PGNSSCCFCCRNSSSILPSTDIACRGQNQQVFVDGDLSSSIRLHSFPLISEISSSDAGLQQRTYGTLEDISIGKNLLPMLMRVRSVRQTIATLSSQVVTVIVPQPWLQVPSG